MFQSTHPRGVRQGGLVANGFRKRFQSTHPRGVRLSLILHNRLNRECFNPRTREGCDSVLLDIPS